MKTVLQEVEPQEMKLERKKVRKERITTLHRVGHPRNSDVTVPSRFWS